MLFGCVARKTMNEDRLPLIAGTVAIVVAIAIGVYAFFWPTGSPPTARAQNVDDLEAALVKAKRACVDGAPQNAACREAARLTSEIAKARATR